MRVLSGVQSSGIPHLGNYFGAFENWVDLQPESIQFYRGRARFETRGLPYALLRDIFAFRFEIQDDEPAQIVREKLISGFEIGFGADDESEMKAHVIGQLLGYDFRSSQHLTTLVENPQKLREQAVAYLVDYFQAICAQGPAMILLEDLHWADDSSLDMLNELSSKLPLESLLILAATRPALLSRRCWRVSVVHLHPVLRPRRSRRRRWYFHGRSALPLRSHFPQGDFLSQ